MKSMALKTKEEEEETQTQTPTITQTITSSTPTQPHISPKLETQPALEVHQRKYIVIKTNNRNNTEQYRTIQKHYSKLRVPKFFFFTCGTLELLFSFCGPLQLFDD